MLVTAKDNRHTLFPGEGGNGPVNGLLQFGLQQLLVGAAMPLFRKLLMPVVLLLLKGLLTAAEFSTCLVEDEVPGDGKKKGGELGGGLVAGSTLPEAQEDLLGNILRLAGDRLHVDSS